MPLKNSAAAALSRSHAPSFSSKWVDTAEIVIVIGAFL